MHAGRNTTAHINPPKLVQRPRAPQHSKRPNPPLVKAIRGCKFVSTVWPITPTPANPFRQNWATQASRQGTQPPAVVAAQWETGAPTSITGQKGHAARAAGQQQHVKAVNGYCYSDTVQGLQGIGNNMQAAETKMKRTQVLRAQTKGIWSATRHPTMQGAPLGSPMYTAATAPVSQRALFGSNAVNLAIGSKHPAAWHVHSAQRPKGMLQAIHTVALIP